MKTSWQETKGKRTIYIDVHYNEVVVGHHYGTGMTDNAGACSHQEFLEGRFQGLIEERFGKEVLNEVLYAVEHSHENPEHNAHRKKISKIKKFIDDILIDDTLRNLYKHPDTINGFMTYGNRKGYKSYIESDNTSLTYESTKGVIENKQSGEKIKLTFEFHATSCVELHDYYFLTGNDNFYVISPQGAIIFTTERELEEAIFGYQVRIDRVFRNKETIFFSYWAFDREAIPRGLIKYELNKGLTGRTVLKIK